MEIRPIESQAPDVVIVVGDGNRRQEFACYRLFLSSASRHFGQLFSATAATTELQRIEWKDKDPDEWKLFYSFVDPATLRNAAITPENVEVLVRWFHGFGMAGLLAECDAVLATKLLLEKDEQMETLVSMGDIAVARNLDQTKEVVKKLLVPLLKDPRTRSKVFPLLQKNHESLRQEMEKLLPRVFNADEMFAASDHSIGNFMDKGDNDDDNPASETTNETPRIVRQTAEFALDEDKFEQLVNFLRTTRTQGRTLVFADSTLACDHIAQDLSQAGWPAHSLHKGLKRKQSKAAFESFKAGGTMVVTDFTVSKLNVEIPPPAMVISYDMPSTLEEYQKRLERAGTDGAAHSFLGQWDSELLSPLRRFFRQQNQQVPSWLQEMADFHSE